MDRTPVPSARRSHTVGLFGRRYPSVEFRNGKTVTCPAGAELAIDCPIVGSIDGSGLDTAPGPIASPQMLTVTATSVADPSKSASATVMLYPPIGVTVSPGSADLDGGQQRAFSATVTNTPNTAVSWSLNPQVGSVNGAGVYTAPLPVPANQTVSVLATSAANGTTAGTAQIRLYAVSIGVSPGSASLLPSQTAQFSAPVGHTTNTGVTWSLSPNVGSISASGLYTAPSTIVGNQAITVMATSAADGSKTASATVNLIEPVAVTLSPNVPVSVSAGNSQAYTATVTGSANTAVTWSRNPVVGSLTGGGNTVNYVAPAALESAVSFTLTATSVADPTKSASVTVTVVPVNPWSVSVSPRHTMLTAGQSFQFSAAVANRATQTVNWSI